MSAETSTLSNLINKAIPAITKTFLKSSYPSSGALAEAAILVLLGLQNVEEHGLNNTSAGAQAQSLRDLQKLLSKLFSMPSAPIGPARHEQDILIGHFRKIEVNQYNLGQLTSEASIKRLELTIARFLADERLGRKLLENGEKWYPKKPRGLIEREFGKIENLNLADDAGTSGTYI